MVFIILRSAFTGSTSTHGQHRKLGHLAPFRLSYLIATFPLAEKSNAKSLGAIFKVALSILCLTASSTIVSAQYIDKSVMTPNGGHLANIPANIDLHWSLGELTSSYYGNSRINLTEGFHQVDLLTDPIYSYGDGLSIEIFPNPTSDKLWFRQAGNHYFKISIRDLQGHIIWQDDWKSPSKAVDLSSWPSQTFLLTLISSDQIRSFKIQKIN